MTALAKDTPRNHAPIAPDRVANYPLLADTTIFMGSFVGLNTSAARPLVAGDTFLGIALNDSVSYAEGDRSVGVAMEGLFWISAITGSTGLGDLGDDVYATDSGDLSETAGSNTLIGRIVNYDADKGFLVHFKSGLLWDLDTTA